MDAIALLRKQHAEVKSLFKAFEKTDDAKKRVSLFEEIADNLAAHSTIEETIFYPAIFRDELEDMLEEAVEEHLVAKRLIADVMKMKPSDRQYAAKVIVLGEVIAHHIEEEHDELFPQVREALEAKQLKILGAQMKEKFDELMATKPRRNVPAELAEAAALPIDEAHALLVEHAA